jgi:dipeptidyl aminopeptidase/acylaminoacyl peptidase
MYQIYAAHGFAVANIDFHGSQGYGQPFTDSIINDYGYLTLTHTRRSSTLCINARSACLLCSGKPFNDILLSLDFLTSRYTIIDSTRIHGLGASYGAWMINWINGHTNRFRCLVAHDGVFDMTTKYYEYE